MANLNSKSRYNNSYLNVVPPYFGADGKKYDNYFDMVAANTRFAQQEIQNELLQEQNELLKEQNELAKKQQKEIEEQKRKELERMEKQKKQSEKEQFIELITEYHSIALESLMQELEPLENKITKKNLKEYNNIKNRIYYHSCVLLLIHYSDIDNIFLSYNDFKKYEENRDYEKEYDSSVKSYKRKEEAKAKKDKMLQEIKPQLDKLKASHKRLLQKKYYNEYKIKFYKDRKQFELDKLTDKNNEFIEKAIEKVELEDKLVVPNKSVEGLEKFRNIWLIILFFTFLPLLLLCEIVSWYFLIGHIGLAIIAYISISIKEHTTKNNLSKEELDKILKLENQLPEIEIKLKKMEDEIYNLECFGSKTKPKIKSTKIEPLFISEDGNNEEVIEPDEDNEPIIDETLEDEDYDKFINDIDKDELDELNEDNDEEDEDDEYEGPSTIILHKEGED